MNEIYFPDYAWDQIKSYMSDWDYHNTYTKIRNEHGIGNYAFQKKTKYLKSKQHKESIKKLPDTALHEKYCYLNLMFPSNYIYVDEYLKLIPKYLKKTKTIRKMCDYDSINLYGDVFHKDPLNRDKYPDFGHDGCFYIAMIFYGYEYKKRRNGNIDWNCDFK
jgi:hypothetical protein